MSRTRKKDSKVCRKTAPGVITCPKSKATGQSTVLAIPSFPSRNPSILIDSSGLLLIENHVSCLSDKKMFLDYTTKHPTFVTTALQQSYQLKHGCSVFYKNELLIFGVHKNSPNWSTVSDKAFFQFSQKIIQNLTLNFSDFEINERL